MFFKLFSIFVNKMMLSLQFHRHRTSRPVPFVPKCITNMQKNIIVIAFKPIL